MHLDGIKFVGTALNVRKMGQSPLLNYDKGKLDNSKGKGRFNPKSDEFIY